MFSPKIKDRSGRSYEIKEMDETRTVLEDENRDRVTIRSHGWSEMGFIVNGRRLAVR